MSANDLPGKSRRATMTDVAKAAGVSQSTVSAIMNNMPGARLAQSTRDKVLRVAEEMGYSLPRRAALAPPSVEPNVIGYLVDEISTSPYPLVGMDGAQDAAWDEGCVVTTLVTRNNLDQAAATIAALVKHPNLLGIVYSTIFTREVEVPEALHGLPLVLLNCYSPNNPFTCVLPGDVGGGQAGAEYLISQGHQRIGFINGEAWRDAAEERLKGYRRALATADLPFDPNLVRSGDWMSGSGFDHTLSLMKEARPPTAIFCANDLMAVGAMEALRQLGLRVPEDVSVMGYDDQEMSRHTHPPLTTLELPGYEMGRTAVELLMQQIAQPTNTRRQKIKIDCPLVVRQTVAAPRLPSAGTLR
jgi:LacI family transcriptional regulator